MAKVSSASKPIFINHETRFYHNYDGPMRFYTYDSTMYAPTFPLEWYKDHLPTTGPDSCQNCKTFGCWNGAFLGYCVGCADKYNGTRGNGFIFYGEEKKKENNSKSAFSTYLKDVELDKIGDKKVFDTQLAIDEINSHDLYDAQDYFTVGYGSSYDGGYDSY